MYIYLDNLKSKAALWIWQLRDIGIIGIYTLVSILALTQADFFPPVVVTAVYTFLTIRFEDTSIMGFIRYACGFFFTGQQLFEWRHGAWAEKQRRKRRSRKPPSVSSSKPWQSLITAL